MTFYGFHIFALHDNDDKLKAKGQIDITKKFYDITSGDIAARGNQKGYGIFWVVNDFEGARKKENLEKINYWYCDIDEGSKPEQLDRLKKMSMLPSFIIETKKGYHCYWAVKGAATLENFEKIEQKLIELLHGDKHCKDPLRLLRCPGYYHMKNPKEPFLCDYVDGFGSGKGYTEAQMLDWLCYKQEEPKKERKIPHIKDSDFLDENNWERIFKISEIYKGNRNGMLTRYTFWLKDEGLSSFEIDYIIRGINDKLTDPLPTREVDQLLRSKL